jgi:hypothetical protein
MLLCPACFVFSCASPATVKINPDLNAEAQVASINPKIERVEQKVDALQSAVDQSVKNNDDWTLRILAVALGGSALLGYLPGKTVWTATKWLGGKLSRVKGA